MNPANSIRLYDERTGKEITIIIPERPEFFKFKANKTYEVEVDLQRFPIVRKFKNKKGEEYWACVYNLRVLKVDGTPIENPRWVPRRVPAGNVSESENNVQIVPRIGSEFHQLLEIMAKYGAGIHRCIVETREGNNEQVLTRFKHSEDCECLKNKSNERSGQEDRGRRAGSVENPDPKVLVDEIKRNREKFSTTVEGLSEKLRVSKEIAEKIIQILKEEGCAVDLGNGKYLIDTSETFE